MMSRTFALTACCLLVWAGGCESYYKVTDPTTGKTYYTKSLEHSNSGSATLIDGRNGNKVRIQNSEVDPITKEEFEAGKSAPPPAETKPAEPTAFK